MGYVARYRADAQAKDLPGWDRFYIAEIEATGEAILVFRKPRGFWQDGHFVITFNEFPELPLTFPGYKDAFGWLEERLARGG